MIVTVQLFGAFRQWQTDAPLALVVADDARIADVRAALHAHAQAQWPGFREGLLQVSAFASDTQVLRDADPVPGDGRLAVLPPVNGG